MNELGDGSIVDEDVDDDEVNDDEDTVVLSDDDTIEMTGEVNVEALVAKIESTPKDDAEKQRQVRKRLDELAEQRDKDLDGTYNFNLDDEL